MGEGLWSLVIDGASIVADVAEPTGCAGGARGRRDYRIRVEEETRYLIRTRGGAGRRERAGAEGAHAGAGGAGRGRASGWRRATGFVILEAMKMENEFRAAGEGTVKEIRVQAGQTVNPGDVLVVIE